MRHWQKNLKKSKQFKLCCQKKQKNWRELDKNMDCIIFKCMKNLTDFIQVKTIILESFYNNIVDYRQRLVAK